MTKSNENQFNIPRGFTDRINPYDLSAADWEELQEMYLKPMYTCAVGTYYKLLKCDRVDVPLKESENVPSMSAFNDWKNVIRLFL